MAATTTGDDIAVEDYGHTVFNNSVIVRHLLKFMLPEELLKLRLLNRLCNTTALLLLTSTPRLRIRARRIFSSKQMERFLTTMRNGLKYEGKSLYNYFTLEIWDIDLGLIQQFSKEIGPSIIKCKLFFLNTIGYKEPSDEEMEEVHQVPAKAEALFSRCPRLQSLTLKESFVIKFKREIHSSISFDQLRTLRLYAFGDLNQEIKDIAVMVAQRAPNLENFFLNHEAGDSSDYSRMLYQLPIMYNKIFSTVQPPTLSLKTALLNSESEKQSMEGLMKLGLTQIKRLHLKFMFYRVSDGIFQRLSNLIQRSSETLMELELIFGVMPCSFDPGEFINAPVFPMLLKLKLITSRRSNPVCSLRVGLFPNLRSVDFGDYCLSKPWFDETHVILTMESMTLRSYVGLAQTEVFHKCFPNLKSLMVGKVSFSFVKYVLTHLSQLRELKMGQCAEAKKKSELLWNAYTAESPLPYSYSKQCSDMNSGNAEAGVRDVLTSLGNFSKLQYLCLSVESMLEVDAIAYVSCPGKLSSLENLVIQYFVPEPSYSRFTDFRGYNASDDETLVLHETKRILENYHAKVNYRYCFY